MRDIWRRIEQGTLAEEGPLLRRLMEEAALSPETRARIADRGAALVRQIRNSAKPGLMEVFLA